MTDLLRKRAGRGRGADRETKRKAKRHRLWDQGMKNIQICDTFLENIKSQFLHLLYL